MKRYQVEISSAARADLMALYDWIADAAVAQHERERISERVKAGMKAAHARGQHLGRKHKMSLRQIRAAKIKIDNGEATIAEMAALNGVHP